MRRLATIFVLAFIGWAAAMAPASFAAEGPSCSWFAYQEEAQEAYDIIGEYAPVLDTNGDGVACTELPSRVPLADLRGEVPSSAVEASMGQVVDGNTIGVTIDGDYEEIRLLGIEAADPLDDGPARGTCQAAARQRIGRMLMTETGRPVWLEHDVRDRDENGLPLRYVWFEGAVDKGPYMVNEILAYDGASSFVPDMPGAKYDSRLEDAASDARAEGRGLWSQCGGSIAFGAQEETPVDGSRTFSGLTDTVTDEFSVAAGVLFLSAIYSGDANFAVWLYGAGGERGLIFNEIGPYDGEVAVPVTTGDIFLAIETDGPWEITVTQRR